MPVAEPSQEQPPDGAWIGVGTPVGAEMLEAGAVPEWDRGDRSTGCRSGASCSPRWAQIA